MIRIRKQRRADDTKALGSSGIRTTTGPPTAVQLHSETRTFSDIHRTIWAVSTVCGWLGRNLATYDVATFDRREGEADKRRTRDPMTNLLRAPLPGVSRFEFLRWLMSSAALSGNAYAVIVSQDDRVRSLVPVPSHIVTWETAQNDGEQDAYVLNLTTGQKRVARSDMLHVRLFDPANLYAGQSPIDALRDLIAEDVAAGKDRRRFYQNAARPYGVVERSLEAPVWDRDQREAWRADWAAYLRGDAPYNADGGAFAVGLLEDGMKFTATDRISPRDAAFVEGREQVLRAVAAAFGIPHQLVNTATENLSAAARLVEQTLAPYVALLEGTFDAQLVPRFYADQASNGRIYTKLLRPITVTDSGATESLAALVKNGVITPDEARGALGMPPHPDGGALQKPPAVAVGGAA